MLIAATRDALHSTKVHSTKVHSTKVHSTKAWKHSEGDPALI
jgi:hypothetical protein